jgi:Flp pilus assembly protein CpaB
VPNASRRAVGPGSAQVSAAPNGLRPLQRRRALLNGRAALGALLVALATLILFSAAERGGRSELQRYVVAKRALGIGSHITAPDLTTSAMHLPAGRLRSRLFERGDRLVGAVVVAPIAAGELVQASAVLAADGVAEQRQISVPIESARALGDRLQPGELVDVVATFGAGAEAFTVTVVTGARVVARDAAGGPLGDRKSEVVVLAVPSSESGVAIAHAIAAGQISLVRVTGVAQSTGDSTPYRAPRPTR